MIVGYISAQHFHFHNVQITKFGQKSRAKGVVCGSLAFLQITYVLPIIAVALATFKECAAFLHSSSIPDTYAGLL